MSFAEVQFPADISYGATGGPMFLTDIVSTLSGHEQRNSKWSQSRARYNIASGIKTETQWHALIAFFRARRGKAVGFRFKDWSDYRAEAVQIGIGDVYSPSCRAILGDSKCKVALAGFTVTTTVSTVINNQTFIATALTQTAGWFTGGEVEWTSSHSDGRRMEVKEFAAGKVVLALPMGKSIQVGDNFRIIAGCDKTRETCQSKFSNILNFRGEPDVPGVDRLLMTSGTMNKVNRNS